MEPTDQPHSPPPPPGAAPSRRPARRLAGALLLPLLVLLLAPPLFRRCAPAPSTPSDTEAPAPAPRVSPPSAPPSGPAPSAADLLLAPGGSGRGDVAALADLVTNYLVSMPPLRRPALGFNEDFVRALSDPRVMGDAALKPGHPAVSEGRLLDRWGTPWFFHPLSAEQIEVRSAGPDRELFTADDLSSLDP